MTRKTAADFDPALLELYDGYAHGRIDRREFLRQAGRYAVGGTTAAMLLAALSPDYALAQQVQFTDPDIVAEYVRYPSPRGHGEVRAYRVRPAKATGKVPGVVVAHENRGLNPYIEDVARRVAKAGFIALAPDGLSSVGGYPGNDEAGRALQQTIDPVKLMDDFLSAFEHLRDDAATTGKVGVTGFCYGGAVCHAIAVAHADLAAAVPFYGRQADPADVAKIRAPVLLHFAEKDERVNATWPAVEAAMREAGTRYEAHVYAGTGHGFHNDSTPRYDAEAAALAWSRTLDWFRRHLA